MCSHPNISRFYASQEVFLVFACTVPAVETEHCPCKCLSMNCNNSALSLAHMEKKPSP